MAFAKVGKRGFLRETLRDLFASFALILDLSIQFN